MPLTLTWQEIALRLGLTVVAGLVIGFNRRERGRPAGMRTTLLVCLAASLSMIQANLLMNTTGKASDSFVVLDMMRLPLGILSGMGFIGAGAILRRDNLVVGLTTAATLWFVTVMGLCFGGGQIGLGLTALGLGFVVLWGLSFVERAMRQDEEATLILVCTKSGPSDDEIRSLIHGCSCEVNSWGLAYAAGGDRREVWCEVRWRARPHETAPPEFVGSLARRDGVASVRWQPRGISIDRGPEGGGSGQQYPKGTTTAIAGPP